MAFDTVSHRRRSSLCKCVLYSLGFQVEKLVEHQKFREQLRFGLAPRPETAMLLQRHDGRLSIVHEAIVSIF